MSLWTMCVEVGSYDRRRCSVLFSTPDITLGLEAKVSVTLVKGFFIYNHGISLLFFQVNNYVFISSYSYLPLNYIHCNNKMLLNDIHRICSFFSSGIEISRGNSLPCDAELRALLGGIPDIETDSVAILPSPRVSPDIFHDIPGLAVTSESEDNSGKNLTQNDIEP